MEFISNNIITLVNGLNVAFCFMRRVSLNSSTKFIHIENINKYKMHENYQNIKLQETNSIQLYAKKKQ